jgi:fructoselysine 6-phosphate deglycase
MNEQDLARYVAEAKESLYFSGARIDEHLVDFLARHGDECEELGRRSRGGFRQIYLAGSGGSWASLQTARYILDRFIDVPVEAVFSYDLVWRQAARLDEEAIVFLASYSGETEDTVAALRAAKARGARTVAILGRADSTMGREADEVITYESGAIFEVPIVALILFAIGLQEKGGDASALVELRTGIEGLPGVLRATLDAEEVAAETKARDLLRVQHLYVLGSGVNGPLAWKLAMNVVMENVRIGATFSDASEWRHGPAEAMERLKGTFVVLLGTDEARSLTQRTIEFCLAQGSEVVVYDAAAFGDVHPLLTPLIMNSHTQWLVVYSAILRGITDLDPRVFMGRSVLATGGAQWP